MADKLSMGNNHSTFKYVSIDAGVKELRKHEKQQYWLQKKKK